MTLQANPEAIPFCVAGVIAGILVVVAWRRRAMPAALAFATMMIGEGVWALAEALELVSADLSTQLRCIDLRVVGAVTTILGLLAFVLRYTGRSQWLTPGRFGAICAPMLALTVLAWTNPWHQLFWARISPDKIGRFSIAIREYGPGFWVIFACCYALLAVCTLFLAQAVFRSSGVFRAQAGVMLFGVLLPWVVNILDMSEVFGFIHIDTAAMAFAITGLAFLPGLFRFRLLDLTPVAWAAVVEGINDPVVVIDPRSRVVDLNPAAEQLAGRKSHEVLGVEAARAFGDWPELVDRLDRIGEHGEVSFELGGPVTTIASTFDARISRLGDGLDPSGWVLVLRDITDSKRAEAERVRLLWEQAARAEAEAANQAKDRFLATLSHELRTPLTPVLATVTAMLDQPSTPGSLRPVLEMIRRNMLLEVRLIDDLLDLARIHGGKLNLHCEVIDAHELIHRVIEICQADLNSAGLQLVADLAARQHDIEVDSIRLQQVLWNLIKNAIKFTPRGGTVTIRSRMGDEGSPGETNGKLVVAISDTGIGIAPEVLPRIFNIFEQGGITSTRRYGGLGLGLTISRSIVEQHGGRLVAASDGEGRGATFTLELPTVSAPARIPSLEPFAMAESTSGPALRIFLVDDNQDTLNYFSEMLTLRGHKVRTATSLTTALSVASEAEFDLLISDIELPDGSGLQLMSALRSTRAVPGIALSGFGSSDDLELSRSAGFDVHLTKPVEFRKLQEAIQQLAVGTQAETLVNG
jgi:PAS domain S-box-containing protein